MDNVLAKETQEQAKEVVASPNKQKMEDKATRKRKRSEKSAKPRKLRCLSLHSGKQGVTKSDKKRVNKPNVKESEEELSARRIRLYCLEAALENCVNNIIEDERISTEAVNKVNEAIVGSLHNIKSHLL